MNEPLEHAREQLREEFEQLRGEIEELRAEEGGGDGPLSSGGFGKARASLAVLALTAAVAAAAGNFALNGGRTPKDGSVSVPPSSSEPEPGGITADRGGAEPSLSLLSLIGPGLQTDILGSNAGLPSASPPVTGPSPLFVVGDPVSVSGHGSRGGDVAGAGPVSQSPTPVSQSPTPTPPVPEPDSPHLAFSPPPAPAGGTGDGPGNGEVPGDGGKPASGGNTASVTLEGDPGGGGEGPGKGKGHIKANGKGHGGSPGKGHEKDQDDGEVAESGSGDNGSPNDHPGGHGRGKGRGGGPPAATTAPADPGPPPPGPGSGSSGKPGKSESPETAHGKSAAPGQSGK
jgi:hypothetical protein